MFCGDVDERRLLPSSTMDSFDKCNFLLISLGCFVVAVFSLGCDEYSIAFWGGLFFGEFEYLISSLIMFCLVPEAQVSGVPFASHVAQLEVAQ